MNHDLIIRNGTVVDGTGTEPREVDVAISDGRIIEVGKVSGQGKEEIDARGLLVTPGFVDLHTHYDAQVTWAERMMPSSNHGVTTAIMGNCAVGLAPCRPHQHDLLASMVAGVEDIPEPVLMAGVPWGWETYPQYLDALAARRYDMDICSQIAHTAIRLYVMGERAVRREPATADEMRQMRHLVKEAIEAGAFGVSTSRHAFHRTRGGELAPVETADETELLALAGGLKDAGRGVYELIIDLHGTTDEYSPEFEMMKRIVEVSGRKPLTFTLVEDPRYPDTWRSMLRRMAEANAAGLPIKGQSIPRPNGLLFGLDLSFNPLSYLPAYQAIEKLPLVQRIAEMRKPEVRARILADKPASSPIGLNMQMIMEQSLEYIVSWGDEPDYEPALQKTIGYIARQRGIPPMEVAYDLLLEREGQAILFLPASNFVHRSLDSVLEMMKSGQTLVSLGDGGAHYGLICDASIPTFMLSYWARDRKGERLSLPWVVKALTQDTAAIVGLRDRGVLAPGYKADLNIIDFDRVKLYSPTVEHNLPGGGRRLMQRADGYVATIVSGAVTYRNGEASGALPGRLVRSRP